MGTTLQRMGRQVPSHTPNGPSSAARGGEARPDVGSVVAEPRVSVFLEHNLVSALILATAVAVAVVATSDLVSLGTWWTRAVHAASPAASG